MTRFELFETIVRSVSTNILIPQLPASVRWHLLLDILRGTSPFRGGRLRDFPLSQQREIAAKLAYSIYTERRTGTPGRNNQKGDYSLYDLLTSIVLIDMAVRANTRMNRNLIDDDYFTQHIIRLSTEVFSKPHEAQRAAMLLGVDINEWEDLQGKAIKDPNHIYNKAVTLTVIANYTCKKDSFEDRCLEISKNFDIHPKKLEDLDSLRVDLLYLKTRKVQQFLDGCLSNFVLRGASFWCSQVMSLSRDILSEVNKSDTHLLTDSDSIVIMVLDEARDQDYYHNKVRRFFIDSKHPELLNKKILTANYPRLKQYYDECVRTGMPMIQAIPNIGISVQNQTSLLKLATDYQTKDTEYLSYWNDQNTLVFNPPIPTQGGIKCWGYKGESAFKSEEFKIPPWYHSQNKDEAYGWSATLYSLTDITFHQQVLLELQAWLNRELKCWIGLSRYSKNIAKDLGFEDKLSFIKIDGDNVGKLFSSVSTLSRPRVSICLEEEIKRRFLNAVKKLVQKFNLSLIPATLVYFGGDDLLVTVPSELEHQFLSFFADNLPADNNSESMVNFSCAVIRFKNVDFHDKTQEQDSLQTEIPRLLNPLLEISKNYFKEGIGLLEQQNSGELSDKSLNLLSLYGKEFKTFDMPGLHGFCVELKELRF